MSDRPNRESRHVGVMGVGRMGSALARTLATAGHDVRIWSRNPARCWPLEDVCTQADNPVALCLWADFVLTCFAGYEAAYEVLDHDAVRAALTRKALIQMSTATPEQARDFGAWAARHDIPYLDAKIAVTPAQIGNPDSVIFYAGPQTLFDRHASVLRGLADRTVFMGEAIEAAALADFAFLSVYFAGTIGVLHRAALSKACGSDVEQFFGLIPSYFSEIAARSRLFEGMMAVGRYEPPQSALKTDLAGAHLLARLCGRPG